LHVNLVAFSICKVLDIRPCINASGIKGAHRLARDWRLSRMNVEVCTPHGSEHTSQGSNMLQLLMHKKRKKTKENMTHDCVGLLHVRLHEWRSAIYLSVSGCVVRQSVKFSSPGFAEALALLVDDVSKIACNILCHACEWRE
jgi:hypothetical protein